MNEGIQRIGCILMASGLSQRYGKNKLLELLDGREIILHTADRLIEAGLQPLTVTRSPDIKVLLINHLYGLQNLTAVHQIAHMRCIASKISSR